MATEKPEKQGSGSRQLQTDQNELSSDQQGGFS
jgi:hypothetical protein